jgi:hypothetical protein
MITNIRARLEIAEALFRGELAPEEARVLRTKALKRARRGRMLLRIEKIERAVAKLATLPPRRSAGSTAIAVLTQDEKVSP